jgi:ABC-type transport system involved in Fe-S cluster assembly fused permease/ATPase subunit
MNPYTTCAVGRFFGQSTPDLTIYCEGVPQARISINSKVLKEALLSNPEVVEKVLGLRISEISKEKTKEKTETKIKKVEKKIEPKPKAKSVKQKKEIKEEIKITKIVEVE